MILGFRGPKREDNTRISRAEGKDLQNERKKNAHIGVPFRAVPVKGSVPGELPRLPFDLVIRRFFRNHHVMDVRLAQSSR